MSKPDATASSTNPPIPSWLKKLQTESWQAEILLSGLIIFSLLKAPAAIRELNYWIETSLMYSGDMKNVAAFATVAVYWLTGGFITHLIGRGVWVSYVGLSFLFPEGAREDQLRLSPKFKAYLLPIIKPQQRVIRLESVCSGLFGLSFYFFMCFAGITFWYLILNVIFYAIQLQYEGFYQNPAFRIFIYFFLGVNLLYLVDFLSLGFLKRWKYSAPWYYPLYRFLSWIYLTPLYRDLYYIFITQIRRKYIYWGLAVYTVLSFLVFVQVESRFFNNIAHNQQLFPHDLSSNYLALSGMYDNQSEGISASKASLQSEVIRDNLLRVSLQPTIYYDKQAVKFCKELYKDSLETIPGRVCLSQYYTLLIDEDTLRAFDWHYYYHEQEEVKTLRTFLKIDTLPEGYHTLKIFIPYEDRAMRVANIPFYKYSQ